MNINNSWLYSKRIQLTVKLKYFYQILTLLGAVLFTIASDFAYTYDEAKKELCTNGEKCAMAFVFNEYFIFCFGIIIGLIGLIGSCYDTEMLKKQNIELKKDNKKFLKVESELKNCKEENEKLFAKLCEKNVEIVKNWLKMISSELELNTYERLTVYYEYNEEFTLLARFSQNTLHNKVHTQKFPLNQGVISKSWQHNEYKEEKCPIFNDDNKLYYKYMKDTYGYSDDRLKKITMKSDKFFGIAIQVAEDNIGVILYEKITNAKDSDFNIKCDKLKLKCERYSNYLTIYIQDAIELDRGIQVNPSISAEDELFNSFKEA